MLLVAAGFYHLFGAFGITAGVHRLWSHKAFKAKLPLRVILAFMQTVSYQVSELEINLPYLRYDQFLNLSNN
jgi:fatty-acid desaturase